MKIDTNTENEKIMTEARELCEKGTPDEIDALYHRAVDGRMRSASDVANHVSKETVSFVAGLRMAKTA